MSKSSILVLNDYNGGGSLEKRTRTLKSGATKSRYTVTIKSEPLLIQTDGQMLSAPIAKAIEDHYKQAISGITATVSPNTMKARLSAQKALMNGETWAQKRYGGGRTGTRAPARTDRLFNDSGRFIESIKARLTKDGFVVNIAANRLDASTLNGGDAALSKIVDLLRQYVPSFGDAGELMNVLSVRKAVKDSREAMVQKANDRTVELKRQLLDQTFGRLLRLVA